MGRGYVNFGGDSQQICTKDKGEKTVQGFVYLVLNIIPYVDDSRPSPDISSGSIPILRNQLPHLE
jgi:hypothetical protein